MPKKDEKESKPESELTIPNVVREMLEEGEDIEKIINNLNMLGLELPTSKRLIGVTEKKVVPQIESQIQKMVARKEEKFGEASGRSGPRRAESAKRRAEGALDKISETMELVLQDDASKRSIVQSIMRDYREALGRQGEIKKELMRVLLEAMDEKQSRRYAAQMRRALLDIESL